MSADNSKFYKKWWFWVIIVIVLAAVGRSNDEKSANSATASSSAAPVAEAPVAAPVAEAPVAAFQTTPSELAQAYNKNTVSADSKFKGKTYEVTGVVSDIRTDIGDNAVIDMKGGVNEFTEPQFKIADKDKSKAGQVEKGQTITLICVGNGDIIKTPMSKDCEFK